MRAAWLIAAKDLRLRARDRSLFVMAFVAPLGLSLLFNVVFGGFGDDDGAITFDVGVVDLDSGPVAAGFTDLLDDLAAEGLFEVTSYEDEPAAAAGVDDGEVDAAVVLPPGLSEAAAGRGAGAANPGPGAVEIRVVGDVDAPIASAVTASVVRRFATSTGTGTLTAAVLGATGAVAPEQLDDVAAEVAAAPLPVTIDDLGVEMRILDGTTSMVAGLSIFFVFFVAGLAVTGILEERQQGTLPRLLASPAPRGAVIAGKAAAAIVVGIVSLVLLMLASTVLMGADWGDPLGAVLLIVTAVLAVTGVMSLVGGLARSAEQAGNLQGIVAVSMAMLGGTFVPIDASADSLLGRLQLLTPNAWFVRGLGELGAGGVADALPAIAALAAFALVTGGGAVALSGRVVRA